MKVAIDILPGDNEIPEGWANDVLVELYQQWNKSITNVRFWGAWYRLDKQLTNWIFLLQILVSYKTYVRDSHASFDTYKNRCMELWIEIFSIITADYWINL